MQKSVQKWAKWLFEAFDFVFFWSRVASFLQLCSSFGKLEVSFLLFTSLLVSFEH